MLTFIPHARSFLAAGFGLVSLAGLATIYFALRASEADRWVAHTLKVQRSVVNLFSDLQEAETGQRGFLLTGNEDYLEPFTRAEAEIPQSLDELHQLTFDNPTQQEALKQIELLSTARLDRLRNTLVLAQQGHQDQALAILKSRRGKEMMDGLRVEVEAFSSREAELLEQREASSAFLRRWLLIVICSSLVATLGFAAILARTIQRALTELRLRTAELETEGRLRRDTQETLRQAYKLEAVGQLTGGIAHDFNNLLTVILGNLDTVKRRLSNIAPDQDTTGLAALLSKPIASALQGARSAAQLTHRLLAFSRQQPLEPVRLDLNHLVSGLSDLLHRTLGETISLETVLAGGLWPTFADRIQVENVLINLCLNARDAMPKGGRLTIETANAYLDDAYAKQFTDVSPGQYVLLTVADTGTGIAPDVLPRMFEPFFTTKPAGKGSGLGLAMVYGFVKQSGGHIRIYSEIGHGTTVKIYLPRLIGAQHVQAAPAAIPADVAPIPRAKPEETILVVEDNPDVREYARSVLQELGYSVIEAGDTAEALKAVIHAPRIDLLFTDIVLPDATGRALSEKATKLRRGLPVLFTTGYTRNAIIHQGKLDSGIELLTKPYTEQQLARKVREMLDKTRR